MQKDIENHLKEMDDLLNKFVSKKIIYLSDCDWWLDFRVFDMFYISQSLRKFLKIIIDIEFQHSDASKV